MSNLCLTDWFDQLLFGTTKPPKSVPPALLDLVIRLQADGINWREHMSQGGLAVFPHQIHGDLFLVLNYFDTSSSTTPVFKTKVIERFFHQLLAAIERAKSTTSTLLPRTKEPDDEETLRSILKSSDEQPRYKSPLFWGELSRQLLHHRRPVDPLPLPPSSEDMSQRAVWLHDITCTTLGRIVDPLSTVMVPASEHVDAAHWSSSDLLEAFVMQRSNHALSRAVRGLVTRSLHQLLDGQSPSCSEADPAVDAFLSNVSVVHDSIRKVDSSAPPKTIDVFQRLLALVERDYLWTTVSLPAVSPRADDLLQLSERLHLAEREKKILLEYVGSRY